MYFEQFYLTCLAHASYMIGSEGEAAVIEPRGNEGFRVVAQIRKDEWPVLSATK